MVAVYVLILIILISLIILLTNKLFVRMILRIDENDVSANVYCLNSIFRIQVELVGCTPFISFYLFKIKIIKKPITKQKHRNRIGLIKTVSLSGVQAEAYYGLGNPFATGLFSGLLGFISLLPFPVQIKPIPDFFAVHQYFLLDASAYLRLGTTIKNYMLKRKK